MFLCFENRPFVERHFGRKKQEPVPTKIVSKSHSREREIHKSKRRRWGESSSSTASEEEDDQDATENYNLKNKKSIKSVALTKRSITRGEHGTLDRTGELDPSASKSTNIEESAAKKRLRRSRAGSYSDSPTSWCSESTVLEAGPTSPTSSSSSINTKNKSEITSSKGKNSIAIALPDHSGAVLSTSMPSTTTPMTSMGEWPMPQQQQQEEYQHQQMSMMSMMPSSGLSPAPLSATSMTAGMWQSVPAERSYMATDAADSGDAMMGGGWFGSSNNMMRGEEDLWGVVSPGSRPMMFGGEGGWSGREGYGEELMWGGMMAADF